MIFVNFKTYLEAIGGNALKLAKMADDLSLEKGINIFPAPATAEIGEIAGLVKVDIWAQSLDLAPNELSKIGAKGTFLNHSDHKYKNWDELIEAVKLCKTEGLKTLVFADNIEELKKTLGLKPDFVSYEPPELIGSTETSVSAARPEVIGEASKLSKEVGIPLIVGAGIKSRKDVVKSLELGASGVAVSSAVVKADDPKKVLLELTEGFTA